MPITKAEAEELRKLTETMICDCQDEQGDLRECEKAKRAFSRRLASLTEGHDDK